MRYLSVILLLLVASLSTAQEDEEPAPYLYYYSGILNAFVIERADGTDSRLLAQDVMPREHNEISELMWSPSGEWLAWRSASLQFGGLALSNYSGWIVRTDGSERLTMLDHPQGMFVSVDVMEWAPDDDLLFVAETVADENLENGTRRFILIDAQTGDIAAIHEFEPTYVRGSDFSTSFIWMENNQGVIVHENDFQDGLFLPKVTVLHIDGDVTTNTYSARTSLGLSRSGYFTHISADATELIIEDPRNDVVIGSFPLPVRAQPWDRINWNPQHDIIAYYQKQDEDYNYVLRLLDLTMQDSIHILKLCTFQAARRS